MRTGKSEKTKMEESSEFEFCKVCRINHNQGRRHNFFPRHRNSLSSLFSRFRQKLSVVKSSLKNPSLVLPSQNSQHRIWCIFCDSDIDDCGSSFASGNVIQHLANVDHLKNLKHFLWKYGGGMDKVDSFRVTEVEFSKWEKRCEVLEKQAASLSEAASSSNVDFQSSLGQSDDIRTDYELVYCSDIAERGNGGSCLHAAASPMPVVSRHGLNTWNPAYISQNGWHTSPSSNTAFFANGFVSAEPPKPSNPQTEVHSSISNQGHKNQSMANGETITEGYQGLTRVFSRGSEGDKGNVHSGAPPPWLEGIEAHSNDDQRSQSSMNNASKNNRKKSKLNPNRVGAAWAEKRKMELEREKRGEIIAKDSDADWLPNFGRVWQSGSRKESMKEFKKEKLNVPKAERQDMSEIKIRPYVSKRMRQDTDAVSSEGVQRGAGIS